LMQRFLPARPGTRENIQNKWHIIKSIIDYLISLRCSLHKVSFWM
jgi:hypothetical protein